MTDAIYIDFEAVKSTPPSPAILGVLTDRRGQVSFEQVIVDASLRSAAVAQPQVTAATLDATVSRLVASGLPLVGWSVFDHDLVMRTDLPRALTAAWHERYVNALTTARTWRTKVHPTFKIERASEHDAKHTLDKYAALAGYPGVSRLRHGQPAKWIRHLRQQLAARGHYRRVTKNTKADWHQLLRYNREDCYALRHIYLRATFELEKWRAYEQTDYVVFDDDREVSFRAGSRSSRLAALLGRHDAARWAFLTAWNPGSQPSSRAENDERQDALLDRLVSEGYRCLRAEGRSADGSWPPEESVLALDIPERVARALGRAFGQLAIVVGARRRPATLTACG
jgi:hypothetical protein